MAAGFHFYDFDARCENEEGMLFYIGFGLLVIVLIAVITLIAQPPNRWVEKYLDREEAKGPAKHPTKKKI